ncbi:hypothetical protein [Mycobacteroides salmoniphilum]|uniref:Uncharacterized protein n=1 Tax=Mycobacteroides salmoniphilum TaxID=404941 RepID=A0A4V3HZ77_9MYCO|nr:hypothetical protein [Mycobacteroides salmoniphilum]TDZ92137.1 hypothetical protein CCUG60885_04251 [Mycobacteroides salmoniphilum]TEA07366.1 hypothetical protein CCUG60883_01399 [Mycobacteroides salmoniphilum]
MPKGNPETMGEVAILVEKLGSYRYVGTNGQIWHLTYLGEVQL